MKKCKTWFMVFDRILKFADLKINLVIDVQIY